MCIFTSLATVGVIVHRPGVSFPFSNTRPKLVELIDRQSDTNSVSNVLHDKFILSRTVRLIAGASRCSGSSVMLMFRLVLSSKTTTAGR